MNLTADSICILIAIGVFAWLIVGWLFVIFVWDMGGTLAMIIHDIPWAGWLMFAVALVLWPIGPWAIIPIGYAAEFIRKK